MAQATGAQMERTGQGSNDKDVATNLLSKIPGVPLYVQIRETMRHRIAEGAYAPGEKIPSENELGARYGVSRMTVRKAIRDLIREGLLYRSHGVGTFVTQVHIDRDHTRLTDFFGEAEEQGLQASARLLNQEILRADSEIAEALALEEGDSVIKIESLRSLDGEIITLHHAYIPERLAPDIPAEALANHSIWILIERLTGLRVKRAMEKLEAMLADEEKARRLQVEEGAPLLYKERVIFAEDGTPLEYERCYNRGDRYTCNVLLHR